MTPQDAQQQDGGRERRSPRIRYRPVQRVIGNDEVKLIMVLQAAKARGTRLEIPAWLSAQLQHHDARRHRGGRGGS